MGLFHTSDEKIADELAGMAEARDLDGLARKLVDTDERWRVGAAEALARCGAAAVPAAISATLPLGVTDDRAAHQGVRALFGRLGPAVAPVVIEEVLSIDTQLAADVPGRLHYFEGIMAAIGSGAQDDVAPLIERDGPWPELAVKALQERSTRTTALLVSPDTVGRVTFGSQTVSLAEAEEAIRGTARQWAATCLLDLVARGDTLDELSVAALECAVVDGIQPACPSTNDGLPILEPVEIMRRHESGEKGVLDRLQAESLAARYQPADHSPAERRDLEDLFVATLALGVLRKYTHQGAGEGVTPDQVRERFARLISEDEVGSAGAIGAEVAKGRLAGLVLGCAMHMKSSMETLVAVSPFDALVQSLAHSAVSGTIDHALALQTVLRLRRDGD